MTTTSMVPDVIGYLVTTCQSSPSLGLATPPVRVYDGQDINADIRVDQQILWVGHDPRNPGGEAGTAEQDWPIVDKARTLDEDGEITCAAEFWSGDTTMKPNRDGCKAIVAAVATLLRGMPDTGPGDTTMGGLVFWSRISSWAWQQMQASDGASVLCAFKIVYKTRVTTT